MSASSQGKTILKSANTVKASAVSAIETKAAGSLARRVAEDTGSSTDVCAAAAEFARRLESPTVANDPATRDEVTKAWALFAAEKSA